VGLFLIKGFSVWEDWLLTVAGALAVAVATNPMPRGDRTTHLEARSLHCGGHLFRAHRSGHLDLFRQDPEPHALHHPEPRRRDQALQVHLSSAGHRDGRLPVCSHSALQSLGYASRHFLGRGRRRSLLRRVLAIRRVSDRRQWGFAGFGASSAPLGLPMV
jgi:hypothetical protein